MAWGRRRLWTKVGPVRHRTNDIFCCVTIILLEPQQCKFPCDGAPYFSGHSLGQGGKKLQNAHTRLTRLNCAPHIRDRAEARVMQPVALQLYDAGWLGGT